MTTSEAIALIQKGISPKSGTWIDLGAGTGTFTLALSEILATGSTIIAADKSPHALYAMRSDKFQIIEADFNRPMDLPVADGILMANALHYAVDPVVVLKNVLQHLKPGGRFILVEYDIETARGPWVPHPVSFARFIEMAAEVGLIKHRKKLARKHRCMGRAIFMWLRRMALFRDEFGTSGGCIEAAFEKCCFNAFFSFTCCFLKRSFQSPARFCLQTETKYLLIVEVYQLR